MLSTILDVLDGGSPQPAREAAELRGDLSDAELRVLRHLPSNLQVPEIAAELFVSANTVRTHLRRIYAKLDAHSRSEAVARARELGLLAPGAGRRQVDQPRAGESIAGESSLYVAGAGVARSPTPSDDQSPGCGSVSKRTTRYEGG